MKALFDDERDTQKDSTRGNAGDSELEMTDPPGAARVSVIKQAWLSVRLLGALTDYAGGEAGVASYTGSPGAISHTAF